MEFFPTFQTLTSAVPDWIDSCAVSTEAWAEQAQRETVFQQREAAGTTKEQEENKERTQAEGMIWRV